MGQMETCLTYFVIPVRCCSKHNRGHLLLALPWEAHSFRWLSFGDPEALKRHASVRKFDFCQNHSDRMCPRTNRDTSFLAISLGRLLRETRQAQTFPKHPKQQKL